MYYKDSLTQTAPDLIMQEYVAADLQTLRFQSLNPDVPTYDKNVRRALMIGTDMESFVDVIHFGYADMQSWPYNAALPESVYTPIEDLPPSTRELFVYDPDKAKQLIVDAGYPDGFRMDMVFIPTEIGGPDVAALLQDQWALIGVDLSLRPVERAIRNQMMNEGTWKGVLMASTGNARPLIQMSGAVQPIPTAFFYQTDPWFVEMAHKATAEMDLAKQAAILKELGVYYIDQAIEMSAGTPYFLNCYWPWVKNYYGEIDCGLQNQEPMLSLIWIDQELKKEMGY
jgi:peptide/nickel transport system substrate-binding protein